MQIQEFFRLSRILIHVFEVSTSILKWGRLSLAQNFSTKCPLIMVYTSILMFCNALSEKIHVSVEKRRKCAYFSSVFFLVKIAGDVKMTSHDVVTSQRRMSDFFV